MEMDCPPACFCTSQQDGKQEIYLEWPKSLSDAIAEQPTNVPKTSSSQSQISELRYSC